MKSHVNSRYGPHREADAPQAQPGLDRRVPEVVAIPAAVRRQRLAINTAAAAEDAAVARDRVAAHYLEAQRCASCGYPAWNMVAGVCGACRRRP